MGSKRKRYVVVPGNGDPCPRCGKTTEIREHSEITARHLAQPFYFSRWFCCRNSNCRTTLFMAERFKVYNAPSIRRDVAEATERGEVVWWGDDWDNVGVDTRVPPWE